MNINTHCFKLTFSFRKIELTRIAKGIASWAPIIIGATNVALPSDRFKNNMTPKITGQPQTLPLKSDSL